MDKTDLDFVNDMAKQLDQSIQQLVLDEKRICDKIGSERMEELREYWNQELSVEESEEIKTTFDYWDKKLIYTWARIKRVHTTRAKVGQTVMKNGPV